MAGDGREGGVTSLIEKRLVIQAVLLMAVYFLFLAHVVTGTGLRDLHPSILMAVFCVTLILLVNADLMPVLWYQKRIAREGGVLEDERDTLIALHAERAGGVAVMLLALAGTLYLVAARMFPDWGLPGPGRLSLTGLVFAVVTGIAAQLVVRTLAALLRYRA